MKISRFEMVKLLVAITFVFVSATVDVWAQCPTNVNLIINGDAEAQQSLTGNVNHDVADWDIETGNFTVIRYDQGGGFPNAGSPGPASRGNYFFSGGPSTASASAEQEVDISACAALVDTGALPFDLSGYFGGIDAENDRAQLTVQFLDGLSILIGLAEIGPVTNIDRANTTGLLARALNGSIPIGTRFVVFRLSMSHETGDNDGYADNLSFVIVAPTAAEVSVGGRVTDQYGRSISRASVSIADSNGVSRTVLTNPFGYFNFSGVETGQSYVVSVASKRYSFSPQLINLSDSVSDLSFVAN